MNRSWYPISIGILILIAPTFALGQQVAASTDLSRIDAETTVEATLSQVWEAWTTNAGAESFFAKKANIHLAIGGSYEILFAPDAPPGQRGAEDLKIISYLPMEMLSFEWSAPPSFAVARPQRTWVVLRFEEVGKQQVKVRLSHLGFEERVKSQPEQREEWAGVRAYFAKAWPYVLANLQKRFYMPKSP